MTVGLFCFVLFAKWFTGWWFLVILCSSRTEKKYIVRQLIYFNVISKKERNEHKSLKRMFVWNVSHIIWCVLQEYLRTLGNVHVIVMILMGNNYALGVFVNHLQEAFQGAHKIIEIWHILREVFQYLLSMTERFWFFIFRTSRFLNTAWSEFLKLVNVKIRKFRESTFFESLEISPMILHWNLKQWFF